MSFWSSRARQPPTAAAAAAAPVANTAPTTTNATASTSASHNAKRSVQQHQQPHPLANRSAPVDQQHRAHTAAHYNRPQQPQQSRPQPAVSSADVQYQLEQYRDVEYDDQHYQHDQQQQQQQHPDEQYADEYAAEYDDGSGYAEEHQQQHDEQQQQQWDEQDHSADEQHYYDHQQQHGQHQHHDQHGAAETAAAASNGYGAEQYDAQYAEYGQGEAEDEQWMDEQQLSSGQDNQYRQHDHEQPMYEDEQQHPHDEQEDSVYEGEAADRLSGAEGAQQQLSSLDSLPSHSHPLHPVQESEHEPTSPEMNASALPSARTLSSTIASIQTDRAQQQHQQHQQHQYQQPASPSSAASSQQSPNTPSLMPLSPSSTARQRCIECVDLIALYCQQSTLNDETTQAALKLVSGLRYRFNAFAASSTGAVALSSVAANGPELVTAMLQFMQSSLTPMQLQPLLLHAGRQVVQHLSLALSSVGCVALTASSSSSPSCQLMLAPSLLQSRLDALRLALRSRQYSQPLLYVSPHHAADIEQLAFALSLPPSSFFVVPTVPHPHSPSAVSSIYTMDPAHLHALLTRHRKEKRQSAVLLLTIGSLCSLRSSSSGYQLDEAHQLTDIAEQFGLWVHAEGSQIVESEQQSEYQQHDDEEQAGESAISAQTSPDHRAWNERYEELANSSAGELTFVPSRVHSISLHANDYFTLPDSLAFTIITLNAGLHNSQTSQASAITRSAVSSSAASVLALWSQLLAVSSRSFSALLALFPALLTLSHAKLDAAKSALLSFNGSLLLSPAEYAALSAPPFLFFSLSLSPPFNHSFFHLTASQANDLLAENLLRRGDSDAELCALLCSPSLTPSASLFSHTGFLYSCFTPCPAAVDSVERHTAAFHHFLDCLQAELDVVAACGALMPTLQSLLSNESDFQLVAPSALSASTRPGLCAFRFTPQSIPPSFHNELTKSLLADLTSALPDIFRGGECELDAATSTGSAASADGSGEVSTGGAVVIVVEVCESVVERGVQSLIRIVHKLSKRVQLPTHIESALSAEVKRSIEATEAKLKASQAASGGVIRNIPIVGSFFSYFAGASKPKGHTYDLNSSYSAANSSQHDKAADKVQSDKVDASKRSTTISAGSSTSGSGSGKQTPLVKPTSTPPTPPTAPLQPTQSQPISTVLPNDEEHSGVFSRSTSAALNQDSDQRQGDMQHELSIDDQQLADEPQQQHEEHNQQQLQQYTYDTQADANSLPAAAVSEQHLFDQLSTRDPADLLAYISDGTVLTIFFPSDPAQPDSPSSAIPLYLFYDADSASLCWCEPGARYVVAEQTLPIAAIAELHLGNANSAFPADADESRCFSIVSDLIQLHCEEESADRRDEVVLALYSLLSYAQGERDGTEEADDQQHPHSQPQESLQSQQPQHHPYQQQHHHQQQQQQQVRAAAESRVGATRSNPPQPKPQPQQQQQQRQQPSKVSTSKPAASEEKTIDARSAQDKITPATSRGEQHHNTRSAKQQPATASSASTVTPAAVAPANANTSSAQRRGKEPNPASSSSIPSDSASAVPSSLSLPHALELLECGSDFTVFLVDRSNPHQTSRHPVVLWWIPDSAAGKGRLCWSRRSSSGPTRLEYHPSRSLLLSSAVELSLGKQTKALCNAGMDDVDAGRCVSVMVDRTVLNLAAVSEQARDEWLAALHTVMIHGNKKLTTVNNQ